MSVVVLSQDEFLMKEKCGFCIHARSRHDNDGQCNEHSSGTGRPCLCNRFFHVSDVEKVEKTLITYSGIIKNSVVESWLDGTPERTVIPRVWIEGMDPAEARFREVIKNVEHRRISE